LGWGLLCSVYHSIHSSDSDESRVNAPLPHPLKEMEEKRIIISLLLNLIWR